MKKIAPGMALIGLFPSTALADTYTGKVSLLRINDTGSIDFRVFLDTPMTNCNLNFGFVDRTSGLFNVYVAGLSSAYSMGETVSLQRHARNERLLPDLFRPILTPRTGQARIFRSAD